MKIGIFSTHILWPTHFETELEIIQNHIDNNDEIIHFVCNNNLDTCDIIVDNSIYTKSDDINERNKICIKCIAKRNVGVKLLTSQIKQIELFYHSKHILNIKTDFNSIEELRNYKINNYDIGESVVSSIISFTRNPYFEINEYKKFISEYIKSCHLLYIYTIEAIIKYKLDKVYIFNGRFAHTRAILRACQFTNTEFVLHERGNDIHHYELYNQLPHDLKNFTKRLNHYWDLETDYEKKLSIANKFYTERINGIEQSWYSYTNKQTIGTLPENWDSNKDNIIIFNSSEDEYEAIGSEWKKTLYENQITGIEKIIYDKNIISNEDIHIYLRLHPNLITSHPSILENYKKLESDNFTIIYPDSNISSYSLLLNANKILTFGSTIGIEAVYWGIPSILAGTSFYRALGNIYIPNSHSELIKMLLSKLNPTEKISSIKFGYFSKIFGIKFKYYSANSIMSGKYLNVDLNKI